jgi:hypothetical protein
LKTLAACRAASPLPASVGVLHLDRRKSADGAIACPSRCCSTALRGRAYDASAAAAVVVSREGLWRGGRGLIDGAVNGVARWSMRAPPRCAGSRRGRSDYAARSSWARSGPKSLPVETSHYRHLTLSWPCRWSERALLAGPGKKNARPWARWPFRWWFASRCSSGAVRPAPPSSSTCAVVPAFGIDYYVGIDGISLFLVVLTGSPPIALLCWGGREDPGVLFFIRCSKRHGGRVPRSTFSSTCSGRCSSRYFLIGV